MHDYTLDTLDAQPLNARLYMAEQEDHLVGWIAIEFREWNRLAQIQGLAVDPSLHRQGIATRLIRNSFWARYVLTATGTCSPWTQQDVVNLEKGVSCNGTEAR
jgi:ribosomal protein S18 acetylase RimI-like enzyme